MSAARRVGESLASARRGAVAAANAKAPSAVATPAAAVAPAAPATPAPPPPTPLCTRLLDAGGAGHRIPIFCASVGSSARGPDMAPLTVACLYVVRSPAVVLVWRGQVINQGLRWCSFLGPSGILEGPDLPPKRTSEEAQLMVTCCPPEGGIVEAGRAGFDPRVCGTFGKTSKDVLAGLLEGVRKARLRARWAGPLYTRQGHSNRV